MNIGFFIDALITVVGVTTPILLAATGELVVEKSGVLNLGLEGMMLIGAVTGFAVTMNYRPRSRRHGALVRRASPRRSRARPPPCCLRCWC